jgi:hypothetical protein
MVELLHSRTSIRVWNLHSDFFLKKKHGRVTLTLHLDRGVIHQAHQQIVTYQQWEKQASRTKGKTKTPERDLVAEMRSQLAGEYLYLWAHSNKPAGTETNDSVHPRRRVRVLTAHAGTSSGKAN